MSAFPYPQNRSYAYGFKPAPFGASAAADAATIQGKYNGWLANKRVSVGGCGSPCYRIQAEDMGNDTVSEGISYGMLLAVYFDDQNTFNGLWNYKTSKNDGLGLMHWRINSGGGIVGSNSATDADSDIAYALYLAHYQWGSGGTFNYKSLADGEVNKIKVYDLDSNRIKPGDAFNDCRYPSYFFPNEYRVFAKEMGDSATWTAVRNNCYTTIAAARNNSTGLLAEQCTDTGQGGGCSVSSSQYKYNSARIPLRMAMDYVYYGDANAGGELTRLNSHFCPIAPSGVVDCYNLNGTTCGGYNSGAFLGPAATSFMYAGGATLQNYYNYLMTVDYNNAYFDGAISLLSLLLLSGNMPNFADQAAMFTPTRTPTPTMFAGSPTQTPTTTPMAFAYIFEDFENAILVNTYNYQGGGTVAPIMTSGISNLTPASGSFSDRMQVQLTQAANYAGHGFDSSYAPASGVMNFAGAVTVRLSIKTDVALSFTVSFREGNGVNGGDDEVYSSPAQTLATTGSWVVINIPVSGFTENPYNPSCNPTSLAPPGPCATSGNNVFNLGSIKAFEIGFKPIIGTLATVQIDNVSFIPGTVPTMTSTKTPFANPSNLIFDDFEASSSLSASAPVNITTYANTANGASAAWALDPATFVAGLKGGRMNYNLGTAPISYGGGGSLVSPYATGTFSSPNVISGKYVNATGAVSLALWMYTPLGLKYRLTFQEAGNPSTLVNGADGEGWYSALLTGTGSWQRVIVDINEFTEDPYNTICNPTSIAAPGPCLSGGMAGNGIPNMQAIWQVGIKLPGEQVGVASRSGTIYFDDIAFVTTYRSPTVTPTFSAGASSPTFTATASPTRSNSPTASGTPTRTASPTGSRTATGTPSASPTRSATPSNTAASSPTQSPLPSATASHSPTRSATPTLASTFTSSATASFSATRSSTPTTLSTFTFSATRSSTPSSTSSATASNSPTRSATPSASPTRTSTPSATASASVTFTYTNVPVGSSPTHTPSISPSSSASYTRTASPSVTTSSSATASPTMASSPSASPTLLATLSASPTATLASSPTHTALPTLSFTSLPTGSATNTALPTASFTSLPTGSATSTPLPSATFTSLPSGSPTLLATQTATSLPSASATPTSAASGTPSASSTFTSLPTGSPTQSTSPSRTRTSTPLNSSTATAMATGSATATMLSSPTQTRSATPTLVSSASASPTLASTSLPTLSATPSPTQSPAPAGLFEAFETGALSNASSSASPGASISQAFSSSSPYEGWGADRINVSTAASSGGASITLGSPYASGPLQNFDASAYNTVRLYLRSDQAVTLSLLLNEAASLSPLDPANESYQTASFSLAASSAYQMIEVPLAGLAELLANSACSPNCASSGNNSLDLASLHSLSLVFGANAATSGAVVDLDRIELISKPATPTPASTATAQGQVGGEPIDEVAAAPNPNPAAVLVKLNQQVDKLKVQVYSTARVKVAEASSALGGPGWVSVALPSNMAIGSGVYHYVVSAEQSGKVYRANGVGSFVVLR